MQFITKNVDQRKTKKNFHSCRSFFMLITQSKFLVAFLSILSLSSFCFSASFEDITWLIDPSTNHEFALIPVKYTVNFPVYVRLPLYNAFLELAKAAHKSGISLRITSWWRSFSSQQQLFTQYWFQRALPPWTSSHHYGQAIDIANTADWSPTHKWLRDNAHLYWFCQTYDGHSSGQWEESRHYEYRPEEFRSLLIWYRDEIYVYLQQQEILAGSGMSKQELFDTYVYPISHSCIDAYPSSLKDPLTGIKLDRKLDSNAPDQLVYSLSRYKFPAWSWLLLFLPPEVRFVKTAHNWLHFASLTSYPTRIQDLFLNYQQRFLDGVERFVLLRTYNQLVLFGQSKISYLDKK